MVTFRRILVCVAAALVTWGMSHQTPAHESGENEAGEHNEGSEHEGSEHEGSEHEGSEQNDSHNDGDDHNGTSSSGSASSSGSNSSSSSSSSSGSSTTGSSSSTGSSVNSSENRPESSRDDSRKKASARSASTPSVTSTRTSATSRTTRSRDGGTERKVTLRTIVGGRGSAEYKVSRTNRSFEVGLENANLSPGQTLSVCVNDVSVGSMTVTPSGRRAKAKLKLETRRGQAVPIISAGSVVTIKLSTATVASGRF